MSGKIKQYRPKHRDAPGRKFNGRQALDDMYNCPEWKRYRQRFIYHNTKCYACGKKSQVVDHLVPHKGSKELFEKTDNHIPLCASCHNTITTLFDRNYRIDATIDPKIRWINNRRDCCDVRVTVKVLPYYSLESDKKTECLEDGAE